MSDYKPSTKEVQELRQRTGAGMLDCKNALVETAGDMEKAVENLRKDCPTTSLYGMVSLSNHVAAWLR